MTKPQIKRVVNDQVKNQVYTQLKDFIVSGLWKPEERLPSEDQLGQEFGVSRVSIRGALHSLEAQGFIEIRRGEGSFVKKLTLGTHLDLLTPLVALGKRDLDEVLEYREIVEPPLTKIAVQKATPKDIADLEAVINRQRKAVNDKKAFPKMDSLFHSQIAKIASNSIIHQINVILTEIFESSMENVVSLLGYEDGITYHERLLSFFKEKNPPVAEQVMREHIQRTRQRIKEISPPGQSPPPEE